MKEKLKGMPEVQGRWARLAKKGAGRDYRSVGEKEAGGWGAATNHRTSVAKPKHCQIDFLHGALGPKTTTFL